MSMYLLSANIPPKDLFREENLTQSNKGPLPTADHVNPGFSPAFFFKYSTIVVLGFSRICNSGKSLSMSERSGELGAKSLGMNLLTPLSIAASIS